MQRTPVYTHQSEVTIAEATGPGQGAPYKNRLEELKMKRMHERRGSNSDVMSQSNRSVHTQMTEKYAVGHYL